MPIKIAIRYITLIHILKNNTCDLKFNSHLYIITTVLNLHCIFNLSCIRSLITGISFGSYRYRSSYGSYETENRRSYPGYWMGANSIELPGHWFWMKSRKIVDFDIFGKTDINVTDSSCLYFDRSNMSQSRNKQCHIQMHSICERNAQ